MSPKSKEDKFVLELMDSLSAPILTHAVAWADSIPDRLIKVIPMARLIASLGTEEMATYPEACAFIMTATYEFPLDHDWAQIYFHVSCTVCEQYWKEDNWETIDAPRKLSEWQQGKLNQLRRWIYERRRKVVKQRIKEGKQLDEAGPLVEQKLPEQLTLF